MGKLFDHVCSNQSCKKPFQHRKPDKLYCSHMCYASRHGTVTIRCTSCGVDKQVAYRFRDAKFCSTACAGQGTAERLRVERVTVECEWCEEPFELLPRMVGTTRFCSRACHEAHVRGGLPREVTLTCEGCDKEFTRPFVLRGQRFCSKSCANSGERNAWAGNTYRVGLPAWNRGLTAATDERLARVGEKISTIIADKIVRGEWDHQPGFEGSHFESKKCGRTFYCRSSYERRYLELLEADVGVVRYEVEPFRIPYLHEGRARNYVPDVLVHRIGGIELVEVKPASLVDSPANIAKAEAAQRWCEQNGVAYVVVMEDGLTT